jgi:L-ribulose-5-phosphate 3-epimerase
MERRKFIKNVAGASVAVTGLSSLSGVPRAMASVAKEAVQDELWFKISLAQWSLHRSMPAWLDPINFPLIAKREFGITAVEYVNQFFFDKARDTVFLKELKQKCSDEGVTSVLIMIDREGNLGDPDEERRKTSVENHHKWVEAAAYLGCHSIRVNARSRGEYDEQMKLAADGLYALCEYGDQYNINVIVENHGGLSSNGKWLTGVMEMVNHPRCGTLPDFGNFMVSREEEYDRYLGVTELMKYAKGVSAKSHEFDEDGNETETDFYKMLKIVKEAGYTGHIGIEYEGRGLSEFQGIWATKKLLEKAGAAV